MRPIFLFSFVVLLLFSFSAESFAQTDDPFAAYDSFRKQAKQEYEDFRLKANAQYAEFLKKAWEEFKILPAVEKPKEERVPPVVIKEEEKQKPIEDRPIVIKEEISLPEPEPQPVPVAPILEQSEPAEDKGRMKFSLYGTQMEVRANDKLRFKLGGADEEAVSAAWKRLSSADYNNLIRDCLELRIRLQLCDWAYLQMLKAMADEFLGKGTNEAELLKAFVFCQSGYKMRLAFVDNNLCMLYGSDYYIYGKPNLTIDGEAFFIDSICGERLYVCNASFPQERSLSMAVNMEQRFSSKLSSERRLMSTSNGGIDVTVAGDENLMLFCEGYPDSYYGNNEITRWALYANAPLSAAVKEALYPQLREQLMDLSSFEAVDKLCRWIQTAFVYEYDDVVWGEDRAFFADETLFYPFCDCEDRSILLTRIVRDLLGLRCALVYYPGHLATAIAVGEDAKGDFIEIDGVKFIVCDPTYIGASIGMTMPGMDNKEARVLVLD